MDYYISYDGFHFGFDMWSSSTVSASSTAQPQGNYTNKGTTRSRSRSSAMRSSDPQSAFSEQLVLLPDLGFHFSRPKWAQTLLSSRASMLWGRPQEHYASLRDSELVQSSTSLQMLLEQKLLGMRLVLCPQHLPKFHPVFDDVLSRILHDDKRNILVLIVADKNVQWRRTLERRWERSLGSASSQVLWLSGLNPDQYLIMLAAGDVMLDPFPFGGGVTTLEAVSVCTPVVTLPARQSVPALAAGMLTRVMRAANYSRSSSGSGDSVLKDDAGALIGKLVANSEDEYVAIALSLLSVMDESTGTAMDDDKDGSASESGPGRETQDSLVVRTRRVLCDNGHVLFDDKASIKAWDSFLNNLGKSLP